MPSFFPTLFYFQARSEQGDERVTSGNFGELTIRKGGSGHPSLITKRAVETGKNRKAAKIHLKREIEALSAMTNWPEDQTENLAKLIACSSLDVDAQPWFFIATFYKGGTLKQFPERWPNATMTQKHKIIEGLESAIYHLEANGVCHGDLNRANVAIHIDDMGNPITKVIDFGMTQMNMIDGKRSDVMLLNSGTPHYIPPTVLKEMRCKGKPGEQDKRSELQRSKDFFAVGRIAVDLLADQKLKLRCDRAAKSWILLLGIYDLRFNKRDELKVLEKHTEYVKRYIQTGHESDHNAVACILALDSVSPALSDGKVDVPSVEFLLKHINLYREKLYREKLKTAQDEKWMPMMRR